MIEILGSAVPLLIAFVGAIVWWVRLEGRINVLQSQLTAMDKRIDGLEERILGTLRRSGGRLDTLVDRP